jgi:hypothetical protein
MCPGWQETIGFQRYGRVRQSGSRPPSGHVFVVTPKPAAGGHAVGIDG